ncbi:hypothetical protein C8Q80DRAFT_74265 [Daedaleopsis nitida]|nr:hypothetical protein C8Q80DRAFT_74265 [Daedaleopsis nitida]
MSVASRNPFALLDDDASRPASPTPAAPAKQAAPAPAPTRGGAQKPRGGPASRGGRYYQRGGKTAPRDKENAEVTGEDGGEPKKRADGEGRGRGRGRGRGGDRGRGRGRQFDRHSATGKTDSDKKVHQGWGGDEGSSELKAETAAVTDVVAETNEWNAGAGDADAWGAAPGEAPAAAEGEALAGEKAEGRKPREPEEEDNTLTLEEYRKKQGSLDIVPKLEGRKVDDAAFKDAVVVTKKDEDETAYFVGKTKSAPKAKAKKEEKVFIEIEARFERPSRGGRGGRGGERGGERGGDRGGRGRARGGGRGRGGNGPNATTTLNVDDETAFPSLA